MFMTVDLPRLLYTLWKSMVPEKLFLIRICNRRQSTIKHKKRNSENYF